MTWYAKLVMLVVVFAMAADFCAGAAAEGPAAFAVLHAIPRPTTIRSIRPVRQLSCGGE